MLMTFLGIVTTIAAAVLLIFMAVAIKKAGVKLPALSNSADKIAGRTAEIVKISLAGTIFLVFLYLLIPNFVAAHHKEIAIIVVAMIVSAILLGIKQEWEKSSTRKILKAHFIVLSIVVVSIVIYKDLETTKWISAPSVSTLQCLDSQDIVARGRNEIIARPDCWSGNISIPPSTLFRIVPEGRVTIRTWSGRVIHDAPGQANWLGDEIRDANFKIISDEQQPVKVAVITRKK